MNCYEFQNLLQRRLDGDDSAHLGPEGRNHLSRCPQCRKYAGALPSLLAGLRSVIRPQPPQDLSLKIVFSLVREHRQQRRRRLFVAGTALAAGILIVALGLRQWSFGTWQPGEANRDRPPVNEVAAVVPLEQTVKEAGSAVASLSRRTASETVGQARLFWNVGLPTPAPGRPPVMPPAFGKPQVPLAQVRQNVSAGFEPMTTSARRAVDLFLREVPAGPPKQSRKL